MDALTLQNVSDLRKRIAGRIGANCFRTWFGDAADFRLNHESLDVLVENSFVGNWIASNFMDELVASAKDVLGTDGQVEVRILRNPPPPVSRAASGSNGCPGGSPPLRLPRRGGGRLRGRLEDFVVGSSNRLAHSAATQMVADPGAAFKLLVLHGGCGLGKTHLLQGICNGLSRTHPTLEWRFVSGEQFTNEYVSAVKSGTVELFRSRFRNVDVLVIDDIHFLAHKTGTQREFLHTFNAIDAAGKAVVLSSDRHPREIGTLSEPLLNRLIAGMVTEIQPPDLEVRREILRRRAAAIGRAVPEEVIGLIAQRITRNVRELEGAIYKLVALASLTKDRITLSLAQTALEDHMVRTRRTPTVPDILQRVVGRFGVTREQVLSRSRDRTVSLARAVAAYLARKHTALSFPEIGRALGNKNHSTALMGTQRVEKWLQQDATVTWRSAKGRHEAPLRGLLDGLEQELSPTGS